MHTYLREFEMQCLSDLANHLNFQREWLPLYKIWVKHELSMSINMEIYKAWVKDIHVIKNKFYFQDAHVLLKSCAHYPQDVKNVIKFGLKISGMYNLEPRQNDTYS